MEDSPRRRGAPEDPALDDRDAWLDELFRSCADRVLAYLLHRTDRETAQDVLQEVFVTAYRKADELPEPPIGWLLGTARRLLANDNRGARRRDALARRVAAQQPIAVDDDSPAAAAAAAVSAALAELSANDREVLTLSAWYGLSGEEAARTLGCSPSAYGVRLHRARHRLADRLRAAGFTGLRSAEVAHD